MMRSWLKMIRKLTLNVLLLGAMSLAALIVLEGFSSVILLFGISLFGKGEMPVAERRHTTYDEALGWVNIRNLAIQDMYGPGIFLRTNSRGFRGSRDVGVSVPDRKLRVICSGDSYTLGYGVDDDHAWCQLLASLDARIEPVNMGQGGYGIDQAYLWYKRDGSILNYDVHVFAFITDDFLRMDSPIYSGAGKPILDLEDGRLVVKNVPVPRRKWYYAPWVRRLASNVRTLKTSELAARAMGRIRSSQVGGDDGIREHTWDVALKVFASLQEMNEARKSALVLVWLPAQWDYPSSASETWRQRLAAESKKRGWIYIDLLPEMQQVPPAEFGEMFFSSHHHYTDAGNQWVAKMLYQRISSLPQLSRTLASRHSFPGARNAQTSH